MTHPPLAFVGDWAAAKGSLGVFQYLTRSNVVHHSSVRPNATTSHRRAALYRLRSPIGLKTLKAFAEANLEPTAGKRSHYRLRTTRDGKFLLFGTGNIILAGRQSHAAACTSMTRMIRHMTRLHRLPMWPVVHSSPNSVVTGQIVGTVSATIKDELAANHSSKFPGIALSLPTQGVTPELYMRRGMVIIPGITSAAQLSTVVSELSQLVGPHVTAGPATQPD
jgi:TATA-box binding protein (TBP) (component of TFIID and TFIIIB)